MRIPRRNQSGVPDLRGRGRQGPGSRQALSEHREEAWVGLGDQRHGSEDGAADEIALLCCECAHDLAVPDLDVLDALGCDVVTICDGVTNAFDQPELGLSNWQSGRLFARGGVQSLIGEPDDPPLSFRPGQGDHTTALALLVALLTALRERDRTGEGQVPVSPWNTMTKGYRTRSNKRTNNMIVRRRYSNKG